MEEIISGVKKIVGLEDDSKTEEKQQAETQSDSKPLTDQTTSTAAMADGKMKALHYDGPFKVSVKEIERPKLQHPDDVIIKVTTTCICGSDLHMYVP